MKARKTVPSKWKPVWEAILAGDEKWRELAKKVNDHSNQIHALEHPIAPDADRVVSNQAAEVVAPKESSLDIVRKRVCHLSGHRIGQLERQVPNTELPDPTKAFHRTTVLKQEILCLACGMTLEEIRTSK